MAAASGVNVMPASIEAAKAGVTTGEWGDALGRNSASSAPRPAFRRRPVRSRRSRRAARRSRAGVAQARQADKIPHRQAGPRRPFQRGRADRARALDSGWTLSTTASASRPRRSSNARKRRPLRRLVDPLRLACRADRGGDDRASRRRPRPCAGDGRRHHPPADAERLKAAGVAAVFTPKDFAINGVLGCDRRRGRGAARPGERRPTVRIGLRGRYEAGIQPASSSLRENPNKAKLLEGAPLGPNGRREQTPTTGAAIRGRAAGPVEVLRE